MTTATVSRDSGMTVLVGAAATTAALGGFLAVIGAFAAGSSAAYGALVGTVLTLVVFGLGSAAVNAVAGVLPTMSMMVALMTYLLQLVLIWVLLSALESSELLESTLERAWIGGAVIIGALAWMVGQIVLHLTRRALVFDLPDPDSHRVGPPHRDGDER